MAGFGTVMLSTLRLSEDSTQTIDTTSNTYTNSQYIKAILLLEVAICM